MIFGFLENNLAHKGLNHSLPIQTQFFDLRTVAFQVSENFYFDMTPEPIKKMLGGHIPYQDISTLSRSCIFSLTNPSNDVFLVIRVGGFFF